MDNHKLSEEEIDEIVDRLCDRFQSKLYRNVGAGIVGLAWRGVVIIILGLAAYGSATHFFK